jgi:hypothetical protein
MVSFTSEVLGIGSRRDTAHAVSTGVNINNTPAHDAPMKPMASLPAKSRISLKVNGAAKPLDVAPWTTLLDALRESLDLTGTKKGFGHNNFKIELAKRAIGRALRQAAAEEERVLDHPFGRFVHHNLAAYHVPVNADVHDIEVIFVAAHDAVVNPLSAKGLHEPGVVGVAAAVAHAVVHATGTRVRDVPITLDMWR